MKTIDRIDIANVIQRFQERNDNTPPPCRFFLPFPTDQVIQLLGVCYKAAVLERIPADRYINLNNELRLNLKDTAEWLTNPDKRPGLLLFGHVGTGKTTLLRAICTVINTTCRRETDDKGRKEPSLDDYNVVSIVKAKGIINDYSQARPRYELMIKVPVIAIDELGVEPMESRLYGNVAEPLLDLICERYDRQLITIVSTNLGDAEIRQRYGTRLHDRFSEMFSTIPFTGKSFRQ